MTIIFFTLLQIFYFYVLRKIIWITVAVFTIVSILYQFFGLYFGFNNYGVSLPCKNIELNATNLQLIRFIFFDYVLMQNMQRPYRLWYLWHVGFSKSSITKKLLQVVFIMTLWYFACPPLWLYLLYHYCKSLLKGHPLSLSEGVSLVKNFVNRSPRAEFLLYNKEFIFIPKNVD